MKNDLQIDTTMIGIAKAISYFFVCFYTWLHSTGIDAYAFHVLVVFMVLDMILGAWKAKRVKELNNPSSREAKKGIATKLIIFTIPVVSGLIWGLFDKENPIKIVNTLLVALALAEGYSVIGNAYSVYSRKKISEFDAITYIFKSVSNAIKNLLEKTLKNFDESKTN